MKGSKVFVSSTVNDLLDLRQELEYFLRSLCLEPMLSEIPESGFTVSGNEGAIESCLANVSRSDVVLLVLSRLYGNDLGNNFESISATHLEMRTALRSNKDIHIFLRDRLDGDYTHWIKSQRPNDYNPSWVPKEEHAELFAMIDEYHEKYRDSGDTGWRDVFKGSADLKQIVEARLDKYSGRARLLQSIKRGTIPFFIVSLSEYQKKKNNKVSTKLAWRNIGKSPAINVELSGDVTFDTDGETMLGICHDGSHGSETHNYNPQPMYSRCKKNNEYYIEVSFEYDILEGARIRDTYRANCHFNNNQIFATKLHSKEYISTSTWSVF